MGHNSLDMTSLDNSTVCKYKKNQNFYATRRSAVKRSYYRRQLQTFFVSSLLHDINQKKIAIAENDTDFSSLSPEKLSAKKNNSGDSPMHL